MMTLNKKIRILAFFTFLVPLAALLITSSVFFISWSLSWTESENLSVPRFLHAPLLKALKGDEVSDTKFAGIIMVLDDKGRIVYLAPRAKEASADLKWDSMEQAYTEIMKNLPNIPISLSVYTYNDRTGIVVYAEQFFSGMKIFRINAVSMFVMYFALIGLPMFYFIINSRPIMRSFLALETAAHEIGKGNLDTPLKIPEKDKRRNHKAGGIESLVQAFEQMRIELKENHENQGRIMMAISHDLKTPLTLIKGYIEALKDGMASTPEDIAEYAGVIYDRSMLLEERINDLIYFAKLRTSDWQARFEDFSLGEMLEEAADIFRNDSLIRKREFSYSTELTENIIIHGDRKLLFQVFENLFDNACRYTSENDRIRITAGITGNTSRIAFEDSGDGISEQHRNHIFESFYRADSGRNTRGLGIGLTSARTIIENHGGEIHYEPSELGGAGFFIVLPVI